jgi:hypothetical protein
LGADVEFSINRVDISNNPVNWGATVAIAIDIDRSAPITVNATVAGNQAVVLLPHATICDLVKASTRWRLCMDASGLTTAIAVGTFERDDGGP